MNFKTYGIIGVLIIGLVFVFSLYTVVDVGERAVVVGFGQVKETLAEGFHFVNPLYSVYTYNVRNNKYETVAAAASSDIQKVSISVAVNYNLNEATVGELYSTYGDDYINKIFTQRVQESIKSVSAKYVATDLITKRDDVKAEMKAQLISSMPSVITVTDIAITNIEFSPSFDAAIEAKVTAEQNALKAKNDLARVQFEADQRVAQAKGEAEAIRVQQEAIKGAGGTEYVALKRLEVEKAAIEKWNGALPVSMIPNSAVPFINVTK